MKKKINAKMMQMVALTLLLTVCALLVIGYHLLQEQVIDDLKSYADILGNRDTTQLEERDASMLKSDKIRITLVNANGSVIYDNMTDYRKMENHKNRPEIAQAMKTGEGQTVRISSTFSHNTYYYAIRLADGSVLRVSKEAGNVWQILLRSLPLLVVVCVFLLVICAPISRLLTRKLVEPIELMAQDMDHMDTIPVYEELEPFVKTIHAQHQDIMKNANMRQEFTANVSHELKTPLTSIRVLADSLMGMENTPAELYQEFMQDISAEIDREGKIIDDLLTLVKMDKSSPDLNIAQTSINGLLEQILKRLTPIAKRRNIEITYESKREVSADVDEVKLSLALSNLVENAIKYNREEGKVWVTLDADHKFFYVKVEDNGVGIPKEFQERVFERFYRVDKARSRETGGTGLGLAITKNIILLHQGAIRLKSEEGKGA